MKFVCALLLVAAAVYANSSLNRYGWVPGKESLYQFESQVLNGIPEINKSQQSGLKLTAKVRVQSYSDYSLRIKMENVDFQTMNGEVKRTESGRLEGQSGSQGGHIPEEYRRHLEEPFLAHLKGGVVTTFLVAKDEPTSVTNLKRSVLAQLQLDVAGTQRSQIESNHIQLPTPEEALQSGISGQSGLSGIPYFTTQEESVHGKCKTSYTINKVPEYKVKELEEQWTQEQQQLQGGLQGKFSESLEQSLSQQGKMHCEGKPYYQVIKTKDFDKCETSPIFQKWTGVTGKCNLSKPSTCAGLLLRTSTSTYTVCGELSQFQIRKIKTENIVKINPLGYNTDESFQTTTQLNMELLKIKSISERLPIPSSTKEEKSLVYAYPQQSELQGQVSEETIKQSMEILGVRPILPQPGLTEAPKTLLPISIPKDQIKSQALEQLKKMAVEVSQSPESCSSKSDVAGTMAAVTQSLRHLSLDQLKQLESEIKQHSMQQQQGPQGQVEGQQGQQLMPLEKLFWDTISGVGTNPSTMLIVKKVKEGSLPTRKLEKLVQHTLRNVRYPTKELLRELVGMAKSQTVKSNKNVLAAVLSNLSDLFYRAYVNPSTMINNFPSQLYGVFGSKDSEVLTQQYIPYLVSIVKGQESGIESESAKQHLQYTATVSLGKTGHMKAAKTLVKIAQGEIKPIETGPQQQKGLQEAQILRPLAVHSMKRIAKMNPTQMKPLLMAIIENPVEAPEVRTAAVAILPFAQPSPGDIHALAIRSWFEPSKQVANFIRSTLISLMNTEVPEFKPISKSATNALPLMKKYDAGFMFSRNVHLSQFVHYLKTGVISKLQVEKSKMSMTPVRVAKSINHFGHQGAFKLGGLSFEEYMQGMDKLVEKYVKYFTFAGKTSDNTREELDNISAILGLKQRGFQPTQLYNLFSFMGIQKDCFLDTETVMKTLSKISRDSEQGDQTWSFNTVGGAIWQESTAFGMTDAGFPVLSTIAIPMVYSAKGHVKVTNEPGYQGGMPLPEVEASITPVLNVKVQSSMGVISPFTKEIIGTGVEASVHSSIPIAMKAKVSNGELEVIVKNPTETEQSGREFETLHGFILPYTFKTSLLTVKPTSKATDMKKIVSGTPRVIEMPFGKSMGISGKLIAETNNYYSDLASYFEKIRQTSLSSIMSVAVLPSSIRLSSTKVKYSPSQSETKEFHLRFKLRSQGSMGQRLNEISSEEVLPEFQSVKSVLEQIKSQNGQAALLSFTASSKGQYSSKNLRSSIILGKSSLQNGEVSKTFVALNYQNEQTGSEVYGIKYEGEATLTQPKNLWNLEQLVQEELTGKYVAKILYGRSGQEQQIKISGKMQKSEEQKQSVKQSPEYMKCQQEMQQDRKLTEVCREARLQASSLDKFEVEVERYPSTLTKSSFWNLMKEWVESSLIGQISYEQGSGSGSTLKIKGSVDRTAHVGQVKIETPSGEILKIKNVRLCGYTKNILPLSVLVTAGSNLSRKLSMHVAPMTCAIEPRTITTFDNKTYGYEMNDCQHLLLKDGGENFPMAVLANTIRSQKQVKIIAGETEVEVNSKGESIKLTLNGNDQKLSPGQYMRIMSPEGSYVQVELKRYQDNTYWISFPQQSLAVITDGKRIEIVGSGLVWSRAVGVCGDMNGEQTAEMKSPQKCVMSPQSGAVSYILHKDGLYQHQRVCQGIPSKYVQQYEKENQRCSKERVIPTPLGQLLNQIKSIAVAHTKNHVVDKQPGQMCISKQMVKMCQGKPLKIRQRSLEFACVARPSQEAQSLEKRALAGEPIDLVSSLPTAFRRVEFEPVICSNQQQPSY